MENKFQLFNTLSRKVEPFVPNADGKVKNNKVELGQRLGDAYELLGGIPDGATVVIAGQGRLADGMEVRVEK